MANLKVIGLRSRLKKQSKFFLELGKHYIWYMGASESGGEVYARSTKIVSVASSNRFSTPLDEHEQIENKKEP